MFALQEAMAILAEQPQSYDEAATIALSALSALPEVAGPLAELTKLVGWRMTDSHTGMATAPFLIETPVTPPSFLRLPWRLPMMGPFDSWWAFMGNWWLFCVRAYIVLDTQLYVFYYALFYR